MPRLITTFLAVLALALIFITSASAFEDESKQDEPITPDEPIDLFNGEDLSNWTYDILADDPDPASLYRVEDGIIKNAGRPAAVMRTKQTYKDYEIEVQWRWPDKGGNSGLLLHSSKPRERRIWPKSIECQLQSGQAGDFWVIGEKVRVTDGDKRTKGRHTTNYTDDSENELGQWNTMIVQARGDTLKVFVNGDLVNEAWDASASSGAICLQAEGTPIEYRKVLLRPLPKE